MTDIPRDVAEVTAELEEARNIITDAQSFAYNMVSGLLSQKDLDLKNTLDEQLQATCSVVKRLRAKNKYLLELLDRLTGWPDGLLLLTEEELSLVEAAEAAGGE